MISKFLVMLFMLMLTLTRKHRKKAEAVSRVLSWWHTTVIKTALPMTMNGMNWQEVNIPKKPLSKIIRLPIIVRTNITNR